MTRDPPRTAKKREGCVVAIIDGAARGNPGPAAFGVVFKDASGKVLARLSGALGEATNNVAEYRALLAALAHARERGWRRLNLQTDSELLARQLDGSYKVRSADLKPLHQEAQRLIAHLDGFQVESLPRRFIREADKLANAALDQQPVSSVQRPVKKPGRAGHTARMRARPLPLDSGAIKVRAVYERGVFKPREPLDVAEGEEVDLEIRRKRDR